MRVTALEADADRRRVLRVHWHWGRVLRGKSEMNENHFKRLAMELSRGLLSSMGWQTSEYVTDIRWIVSFREGHDQEESGVPMTMSG